MSRKTLENEHGRSLPSVSAAAVPALFTPGPSHGKESCESILSEVDFKWLMAGQGWWIDTTRFHSDAAYAAHFLTCALDSSSIVLRECAAALQAEIFDRAISSIHHLADSPPLP